MSNEIKNGLEKGIVLAAALCCRSHDEPVIACDILKEVNISRNLAIEIGCSSIDVSTLDEYNSWPNGDIVF